MWMNVKPKLILAKVDVVSTQSAAIIVNAVDPDLDHMEILAKVCHSYVIEFMLLFNKVIKFESPKR